MSKTIYYKIFITVFILIALHAMPEGVQSTRYTDAIQSLVDFGTFALQKGYRSQVDVVTINNNVYSVIAPGIPLISAPLYFIHKTFMRILGIPVGEVYWAIFNIFNNIAIMAPLLGVVSVMMFKVLSLFTDQVAKRLWLVFIFIFGSLVFFYATNGIWVHVYTMSFVFIAFYLITFTKNPFLIGIFLGLAQIVDYIAILPISLLIGFWIYTQIKTKSRKFIQESIKLLLGYSIFLGILLYYNYLITGSAFKTPNSIYLEMIVNQQQSVKHTMFNLPTVASLFGLTISPFRGIYIYFPMAFLFTIAFFKKNYLNNNIILFSFIYVAFIFIFNSTYYAWSGDTCFGPRHLVMAIPFIIIPIVYCPIKYIQILGLLSIFINYAGVATYPSNNLLVNLTVFLYRGPFLHWLDFTYRTILPTYFNIHISLMTPFFIYLATTLLLYLVWKPSPSFKENKKPCI